MPIRRSAYGNCQNPGLFYFISPLSSSSFVQTNETDHLEIELSSSSHSCHLFDRRNVGDQESGVGEGNVGNEGNGSGQESNVEEDVNKNVRTDNMCRCACISDLFD
jgi:hypothetical protein